MGHSAGLSPFVCYLLIYEEARCVMVGVFERLALRSYCRSALVSCSMADRSKSYEVLLYLAPLYDGFLYSD